jgi:hypothetical protein
MQIGIRAKEDFTWDDEFTYSTGTENIKELKYRLFPNKARFLHNCLVWFVAVVVAVMLKFIIYNKLNLKSRLFVFRFFLMFYRHIIHLY